MTLRASHLAGFCLGAALLAGCSTPGDTRKPLLRDVTLELTRSISVPTEALLLGAAAWYALDPLAPNWEVSRVPVDADRVRLLLRRKRFSAGGDGEALQVVRLEAARLAAEAGSGGYTLVEYTEGIDSALPWAQRVSQALIQLSR